MTVVGIWRDGDFLWAAADTRLSVDGSGGGRAIRTDTASKLLTLPVFCRSFPYGPGPELMYTPHWQGAFGFAFAGDSLPAIQTYATAISCLNDLQSNDTAPPALVDIASFILRLATGFGRDVAQGRNLIELPFEAAVFGWCPVARAYAVYSLRPRPDDKLSFYLEEIRPEALGPVVALGNGGPKLLEEVERQRADSQAAVGPLPRRVIERMVTSADRTQDVGGGISLGYANTLKFQLMMKVRASPREDGKFVPNFTFNNIDSVELGSVGHYMIAMMGYAGR